MGMELDEVVRERGRRKKERERPHVRLCHKLLEFCSQFISTPLPFDVRFLLKVRALQHGQCILLLLAHPTSGHME